MIDLRGSIFNRSLLGFLFLCCTTTASAQIEFDRPKTEGPLPNPYTLATKREDIVKAAVDLLKACAIPLDEAATKLADGKIVTKPVVYTKGVTANSDLEHLATMPASDVRNWLQGRYSLEINALPVDQTKAQIQISARIQGRLAGTGIDQRWVTGVSNGSLEDEVLRGLSGKILGIDLSLKKGQRRLLSCEY
jgi:hypothetical protein